MLSLFNRSQIESIVLRKCNEWFISISNDKYISQPSGKVFTIGVLEVDNIKPSLMPVPVSDDSNPANIVTSCDIGHIAYFQSSLVHHLLRV